MKQLKGITWDHERGYDPLYVVSHIFQEKNPDIGIEWQRRSLKDFGDFPLEKLIPDYDIVMLDHPFTGEAAAKNLLVPLNTLLDADYLAVQKKESLGLCYDSYLQDAKVMALPVDAAALVSVVRNKTLHHYDLPHLWDELLLFCKELGKDKVAVPLSTVDIWCVFLTLNAQCLKIEGSNTDFLSSEGLLVANSIEAIEKLYELVSCISFYSFDLNPISLFNTMASENESIIYAPFAFGYTNYSRIGYRKELLIFFDAPSMGRNHYSTLLGGVGIGISAQSKYPAEAALFIRLLTSPKIQEGIFTQSGGQAAQKGAWLSQENNILCHNFFKNTYTTLNHAYMRPRIPKFNRFQQQASELLYEAIQARTKSRMIVNQINELYKNIMGEYYDQ